MLRRAPSARSVHSKLMIHLLHSVDLVDTDQSHEYHTGKLGPVARSCRMRTGPASFGACFLSSDLLTCHADRARMCHNRDGGRGCFFDRPLSASEVEFSILGNTLLGVC